MICALSHLRLLSLKCFLLVVLKTIWDPPVVRIFAMGTFCRYPSDFRWLNLFVMIYTMMRLYRGDITTCHKFTLQVMYMQGGSSYKNVLNSILVIAEDFLPYRIPGTGQGCTSDWITVWSFLKSNPEILLLCPYSSSLLLGKRKKESFATGTFSTWNIWVTAKRTCP